MTITAVAPITQERRDNLRSLARLCDADHTPNKCTCGQCFNCLWDYYVWDLSLMDGLNHAVWAAERSPSDIGEGLDYEQACEEIAMRVADLEDALLRGVGVGR